MNFLMTSGKSIMAGRLLWLLVAAAVEQGCVLPQDDQVLPNLPPAKNTAPRLVTEGATPAPRGSTIFLGNNCLDRPFAIGVIDPDEGDTIRSKWFVDNDEKFTTLAFDGAATGPTRIVKPIPLFYLPAQPLSQPNADGFNTHYVTVVVADREFLPGSIDLKLESFDLPDGGTVKQSSRTVQYTWNVLTDPTTPCQ